MDILECGLFDQVGKLQKAFNHLSSLEQPERIKKKIQYCFQVVLADDITISSTLSKIFCMDKSHAFMIEPCSQTLIRNLL
nr:hypothetical protein [uncultured Sphaerochaeta sp.]